MKDFKNISFEYIDINVNLSPDIMVGRTGITFTRRILEDLNYPSNVQYCISPEQNVFAIRACKSNEAKAVPFSKSKSEQVQTLNTGNKNILEPIKALITDYNPQMRYRVKGHFDADSRTMYFDFDEAIAEEYRPAKAE